MRCFWFLCSDVSGICLCLKSLRTYREVERQEPLDRVQAEQKELEGQPLNLTAEVPSS